MVANKIIYVRDASDNRRNCLDLWKEWGLWRKTKNWHSVAGMLAVEIRVSGEKQTLII